MRVYEGARLMTLVISTECANPPTLVGGSLVNSVICCIDSIIYIRCYEGGVY
jgi:hypothetical protein